MRDLENNIGIGVIISLSRGESKNKWGYSGPSLSFEPGELHLLCLRICSIDTKELIDRNSATEPTQLVDSFRWNIQSVHPYDSFPREDLQERS